MAVRTSVAGGSSLGLQEERSGATGAEGLSRGRVPWEQKPLRRRNQGHHKREARAAPLPLPPRVGAELRGRRAGGVPRRPSLWAEASKAGSPGEQ